MVRTYSGWGMYDALVESPEDSLNEAAEADRQNRELNKRGKEY